MKKLLLASTVLAGMTAVASAADLPRRAAPPPVFAPVPVFTWTGFYAGFNAGYGFGTQDDRAPTVIGVPAGPTAASSLFVTGAGAPAAGVVAFSNRNNNDGFVGGGQIGYNYQLTPGSGVVIGIEADAQYADFGRNRNRFAATPGLNAGSLVFNPNGLSSLDYFGTVRGRLGYAFDRTLVYGTGGFAYGSGGGRQFGLPNSSTDNFQTGWAAGGGIEYALPTDSFLNFFRSSAVTLKVEGLYVNLDRGNRNNGAFAVTPNGTVLSTALGGRRQDTEFAVVRAGLNYKFGSY
ncbi:outer membrane protein [Methylobacterium soli]|uniref:Porin family protein n=1 Tax=Methylobacterium soli TaxID=553447 RepID=A0A6L3T1H7_9HYPH|nr:outer membrane beta-barrel protein [Methylobacterium soli]KAB1080432.1 porin family protein [Methylobacterium soli]